MGVFQQIGEIRMIQNVIILQKNMPLIFFLSISLPIIVA